jgi:hypothetical protein
LTGINKSTRLIKCQGQKGFGASFSAAKPTNKATNNPPNQITYNSMSSSSFVASATGIQPSGKVEDIYLTKADLSLAISAAEVVKILSITHLASTVPVPEAPDGQTFQIVFDRSAGMNMTINTNDATLIRAGTIEVTFSRQ